MNTLGEYLVAFALIILLGLLANPFMVWMPTHAEMLIVVVSALLAVVYAGFVLKERAVDERELEHRMLAGRSAYLAGVGILTIALLVQALMHKIDPWVPGALAFMIIAKILARTFVDRMK